MSGSERRVQREEMRRAHRGQRSPDMDLCLSDGHRLATHLQYNVPYQSIDAGRENLWRALEAPEHYAAFAEYREKIKHDSRDAWTRRKEGEQREKERACLPDTAARRLST